MSGTVFQVLSPSNCLILLVLAGLVLAWGKWRKTGLTLASVGLLGFIFWGVSPVGSAMIDRLEDRFPQPEKLPDQIAGIIVLGGSVEPLLTAYWGQPALNGRAERLTEGVALARRYPDAPLAFTGGGPLVLGDRRFTEADVAARFFKEQQVSNPLIMEDRAMNTHDNATFLAKLLPSDRPGPWILVTSAYHMPRAVGLFRAAGVDVLPYPVDYKSIPELSGWWYEIADSAAAADFAAREWVALYVYHRRGWIKDVFPAP